MYTDCSKYDTSVLRIRIELSKSGRLAFNRLAGSPEELTAVADLGRLMPPKSTWFEPKLRSGLFIHRI